VIAEKGTGKWVSLAERREIWSEERMKAGGIDFSPL
jgi:hypothetical protein